MRLRPGRFGQFYACINYPDCSGAHGAHPDGSPKGFPGNAATRKARVDAHVAFDRLWNRGAMSRRDAYRWMRTVMSMTKREAHIAKFTEADCRRLIDRVATYVAEQRSRPQSSGPQSPRTSPSETGTGSDRARDTGLRAR